VSKRKSNRREPDQLEQEARRLVQLPASQRKAALDVHRRIAEDRRLSQPTRDHARHVADALETLIARLQKRRK